MQILRYVGVIWYLFHVLLLLLIRCVHNKSCVAVASSQCNISNNRIENRTSLDLVMVIESVQLLTP